MAKKTLPKTVLFSFEDGQARENFMQFLTRNNSKYAAQALKNHTFDPPIKDDKYRECALFVSGTKIIEGTYPQMSLRFTQEVSSHSGNVELKEKVGEEWTVIRKRTKQTSLG